MGKRGEAIRRRELFHKTSLRPHWTAVKESNASISASGFAARIRLMGTPGPLLLLEIVAKTASDHEALLRGLQQMAAEDPTVSVRTDDETRVTVIGAIGERQLETIVDRLRREFGVRATASKPRVAYKETLTSRA